MRITIVLSYLSMAQYIIKKYNIKINDIGLMPWSILFSLYITVAIPMLQR